MRKFIISIIVLIFFVFFASISVVGVGNNANVIKNKIAKYELNPISILLNNAEGAEPKIRLFKTKEDKIIELNLEDYVMGVVASEMPAEFNLEAIKAQAVAVRTYALSHMVEFGGDKCSDAKGGDICDTVHSQVYTSKEDKMKEWVDSKREEYWNKIKSATEGTKGQILTYEGKLVLYPYYFANSGGKTENAEEVFNIGEPYLRSVASPGEEVAPKYKTTVTYSYTEFLNKINSTYKNVNLTDSKVKSDVKILRRSQGAGSVLEIKLGNVTISGSKFREIFGLSSSNFSLSYSNKSIKINCLGYGHGVGMSQWGANAMGKKGESYTNILKHYYEGVSIQKLNY